MRARDWPEGWKRLIWLLRVGNDLEAGFLGQVIFSGENDIGGIGFRTSDEYKAVFKKNAEINKQRIERFMAKEGMMTRRELADRLEVSPHTVNNAYSKPVYGKAKDIWKKQLEYGKRSISWATFMAGWTISANNNLTRFWRYKKWQ